MSIFKTNKLSLRKKQQGTIFRRFIPLILLLVLVVLTIFFLVQKVMVPFPRPEESSAQGPSSVRIMNVYYLPPEAGWNTQQKITYLENFRNSLKITLGYASAYHRDLSKQVLSFDEVGPVFVRPTFRPAPGGSDELQQKVSSAQAILQDTSNGKSICNLVNELSLDQVWLWADPSVDLTPGEEWIVLSPTSNYGVNEYNNLCGNSKSFVLMGFAVNSGLGNAVHSFGHYVEYLTRRLQGDDLVQGRFQGVMPYGKTESQKYPGYNLSERCGNVHTPPNIPFNPQTNSYAGYDYNNPAVVNNNQCEDWNPDGTGAKVSLTSSRWANLPVVQTPIKLDTGGPYLVWWMQQMPHVSRQFIYNGKVIPSWLDFVSNTDIKIRAALFSGSWMNPEIVAPVDVASTNTCTGTSGITTSCSVTPSNSVLGVKTENKSVLAATNYSNMAMVSVFYSSPAAYPNVKVTSVSYCGESMNRVTAPSNGGGYKSEIWYKSSPKSGTCNVVVNFDNDPRQRIITTTIINNVDSVSPISSFKVANFSGPYTATSGSVSISSTAPKNTLMVCGVSSYSEQTIGGTPNKLTPDVTTKSLWQFQERLINDQPAEVWASIGSGFQRRAENENTTVRWNTVKTQPWAATCINLNVKPLAPVGTSTPTPIRTLTPAPIPTVVPTPVPTITPSPTPATLSMIAQYKMSAVATSTLVGYEATKALDTSNTTMWHSQSSPKAPLPQSLTINLGGQYSVSKVTYVPRMDTGMNGIITNYRIYTSIDGKSFTQAASGIWAADKITKNVSFSPRNAAYVRIEAVDGYGGYASVAEVNIWKTNPASAMSASATSQHVAYEATKAIDGNKTTFWHSEWNPYAKLPQSITINLGGQYAVSSISYLPRQDGGTNGTITTYKLYTSWNGITFTLVNSGYLTNNSEIKYLRFPLSVITHIRLETIAGSGGYASAAEITPLSPTGGPLLLK